MTDHEQVLKALYNLRIGKIALEYDLQDKIAAELDKANIIYKKEYVLGPRNRVDFLTLNGTAVEVKKNKPNRQKLIKQIERYASFDAVKSIIIVVETSIITPLPKQFNGKPCTVLGLQKLWGIAL